MNKIPDQTWVIFIAMLGVILALVGYLYPGSAAAQQYIFGAANSLISGAIGAFKATSTAKVPVGNELGPGAQ